MGAALADPAKAERLMPIFARAPFAPPTNRLHGLALYSAPLLGGDAGVAQTVEQMRALIDQALKDPSIIRLATDIVRSVPAFDEMGEGQAIFNWVSRNIRFTRDPVNKEKLYPPSELLKIRAGDCDDISMMMATLLMAIGIPARLITVGDPTSPDPSQFSHVYVEGQIQGVWVPFDAARADSVFGSAPMSSSRMRAWSLTDDSYQDLSGTRYANRKQMSGGLGLGSYGQVRTMGLDPDTSSLIATIAQSAPNIIASAEGNPQQFNNPYNPWGSFQTQYTPNGPTAGYPYSSPSATLTATPSAGMLIAIGLVAFALFARRR